MPDIYDAIQMIEKIQSNEELHIDGLMMINTVNKNYGRLFVRTKFDFVSNIGFYPGNDYISYSVYISDEIRGRENKINALQKTTDETLEKQKRDINELKKKILSVFPKAEIGAILSPYYCYTMDNCVITGEIDYSEIPQPIINPELKWHYDSILKYLAYWKEHFPGYQRAYQHEKDWLKRMIKEEVQSFNKQKSLSSLK